MKLPKWLLIAGGTFAGLVILAGLAALLVAAFGRRRVVATVTVPEDEIKISVPTPSNILGEWVESIPFAPPGRWEDEV